MASGNNLKSLLLQLAQDVCGLSSLPGDTAFWSLDRIIRHIIENCDCCGEGGGGTGTTGKAVENVSYNKDTEVKI